MATPSRFIRQGLERFATGVLIAALGLCAYGLWLFLHDDVDFELRNNGAITTLAVKRREIRSALDDVDRRRDETTAGLAAEEARARQAEKVIATLHDLESTWDRFVGNPAQQKANAEQIRRMEATRDAARTKEAELKQSLARLGWEKDGLELDLGKLDQEMAFAEKHRSVAGHYLTQAWLRTRGWVLAALALYVVVGVVIKKRHPVAVRPERD
jgi:hypothetical protein